MKNNKQGFTLIELLAVVVILGIIMTIAIPNVVSTLEKNKKETFIEDAKKVISAAEYKIRSDTKIEYPDEHSITLLTLSTIESAEIEVSPFDTYYSKDLSFVAITKEPSGTDYEYVYYVHLVSCNDETCESSTDDYVTYNRGINLSSLEGLDSSDRFDLVVKGVVVKTDLIKKPEDIKDMLNRYNINKYGLPENSLE